MVSSGMPLEFLWFMAAWWLTVGIGGVIGRVWLVDRIRINAGGVEASWLRVSKRIADLLIGAMLLYGVYWAVSAIARLFAGG